MDDYQFIAATTYRAEQRSQGIKFPADAVFAIKDASLQRLADRVAADDKLYIILQQAFPLVLSGGEITLLNLSPTLLLSTEARKRWIVTMSGVRFPIKPLPSYVDILNLPPTRDYYFYTLFRGSLLVRDSTGQVAAETATVLTGNYVPLISDPAFNDSGELQDDLLDISVQLLLESDNPNEVIRHGEGIDLVTALTSNSAS